MMEGWRQARRSLGARRSGPSRTEKQTAIYAWRLTVITKVRPVLEIRIPWSVIT